MCSIPGKDTDKRDRETDKDILEPEKMPPERSLGKGHRDKRATEPRPDSETLGETEITENLGKERGRERTP